MNKGSFVFYESVAKQGDRLANRLGKEVAYDFYKAVIDFGLYGVVPDESEEVWLYGLEQAITSISAAKDRYNAAIENGKKGGRPKEVNEDKVLELKNQGMTNKQVAEELKCSVSTIEKINAKNRKNRKNLNDNVNVNVNDNDNDNVNENINENKKEIEEEKEMEGAIEEGQIEVNNIIEFKEVTKLPEKLVFINKEEEENYNFIKNALYYNNGRTKQEAALEAWNDILTEREFYQKQAMED